MTPCTACGQANPDGAKFCIECGTAQAARCPGCGTAAPSGRKFCAECGHQLTGPAPTGTPPAPSSGPSNAGERKQVTVLFADVANSMDLAEALGPDELSQVMSGLFDLCRSAVEAFGGTIDKFTGDGVMALFGAPIAQEDHARRACHAALRLVQEAKTYDLTLRQRGITLVLRIGLNSGEVVAGAVGGGAFTAVGHTVGLAQRMESLATPGIPYLSEHTAALVADGFLLRGLGKTEIKGSTTPVGVFALEGASGGSAAPGRRRSGSARLVGRDTELATLSAAVEAAQQGRAQIVGIVGEAGAGKSRLCEEIARVAGDRGVVVRRTAGVSHAQTAPLLPIVGLLQNYFGVNAEDDPDEIRRKTAERLLGLDPELESELGLVFDFLEVPDPARPAPQLGPDARRRRILEVLRRATHKRSEHTTLVLILEDLHWFDPHSVAFLEAWIPTFPGTRTLVVTNFRPEFHAPWMGHSFYRQLPLAPLDDPAVGALLGELLGSGAGMAALAAQLLPRAGGNPFFAEEIVRGLADEGTLAGEPGAYALGRPASEVRVPATVQAVLSARIDRLPAQDKHVLQAASVIGRIFTEPLLAAATDTAADELAPAVAALRTAELLQSTGEGGEYRFWHPLTQEVAYGTLLSSARRRLHQRVAEALVATDPGRHDEIAALMAHHFDAAGDAVEAARWEIRAGTRATRNDWAEGARRWRSAIDHLDTVPATTDVVRLRVRAQSWLLRFGGRNGIAQDELDRIATEARAVVDQLQDPGLLGWLLIGEGAARFLNGDHARGAARFAEAVEPARLSGDVGLHAWALCTRGLTYAYVGPLGVGRETVEQGIALCADDPARISEQTGYSVHDFGHLVVSLLAVAAGPLDDARSWLERTRALFELRPVADWRAWTLSRFAHLAECTAEPADLVTAAGHAEHAMRVAGESGNAAIVVAALEGSGIAAMLQGDPGRALAAFDQALALRGPHGTAGFLEAALLAHSARAHLMSGSVAPARTAADAALAAANRSGAEVEAAFAQFVRAQILRETATGDADLAAARAAVDAGEALAARTGAATYAAFLAEERARLDGDPSALKACADGYDAIGATGHARRLREEVPS